MKIGVLTFCNTVNYGAVLQAYALTQKLNYYNSVEAELINYSNQLVLNSNRVKTWKDSGSIVRRIKRAVASRTAQTRWDKFRDFEKRYMPISSQEYDRGNIDAISGKYDRFVIGSDQVWNFDLTQGDTTFFLPFVEKRDNIFTYAASFGYSRIPEPYVEKTKASIDSLDNLLVREEDGAKLIEKLCGKGAKVVLDPTLLLQSEDWKRFIVDDANKLNHGRPYVLLYLVDKNDSEMWSFVKMYAEIYHLDILWITPRRNSNLPGRKIRSAGPEEFLNLIYHSSTIITGSFHAICFSIQFSKKFLYVIKDKNRSSRVINLLEKLGLGKQLQRSGILDIPEINYCEVHDKLQAFRDESTHYIRIICNQGEGEICN